MHIYKYAPALCLGAVFACTTSWAADAPTIDPAAAKALDSMGAYLRSLPQFAISGDSSTDVVDDNGQTIQIANHTLLQVKRPNQLHVEVSGDEGTRSAFYDGKTFTFYGTPHHYYATVPAPATIAALVQDLSSKYGLDTPLSDLFYWGTPQSQAAALTSAQVIGDERIAGQICTHYAYRQPDVDWQIWISKSAQPLPCKVSIIDTSNPARPQHTATLKWQLHPALSAQNFRFTPPAGAQRIVLRKVAADASAAQAE